MKTHNFTIVASGFDGPSDIAERFFEAGCDDATIAIQKGLIVIEFEREARTFLNALMSGVRDVERTGAKIERIEPDYLVSASDIAKRAGIGRAAVSLYATGRRGQGFPPPIARVTTESPLWDWVEVASWMYHERKLPLDELLRAKALREVNRIISADHPALSHLGQQLQRHRHKEVA